MISRLQYLATALETMSAARLLAVAAGLGFLYGAAITPVYSGGIDSALFLSGLVKLPPGESSHVYHSTVACLWLIQLPALLFLAGVPAWLIATLQSGAVTSLMFVVVALTVRLFVADGVLALLVAFLWQQLSTFKGHGYLVHFRTDLPLFGIAGFYGTLLPACLLLSGWPRAAAIAVGLLPSLHPTLSLLGGLLWLTLRLSTIGWRRILREDARWVLLGVAVTAISVGYQWYFVRISPPVADPELARSIVTAFFHYWSQHHRQPIPPEVFAIDAAFFLFGAFLLARRKEIPPAGVLLARSALLVTSVTAVYAVLYGRLLPIEALPPMLHRVMPHRWLNLAFLLMPLFVLGALGRYGLTMRRRAPALCLAFVVLLITAARFGQRAPFVYLQPALGTAFYPPILFPAAGATLIALTLALRRPAELTDRGLQVLRALLLVALAVQVGLLVLWVGRDRFLKLKHAPCAAFLADAGRGRSLLLSTEKYQDILMAQAQRGILMGPTDQVNYGPAGALDMETRARAVFGVSILDPDGPRKVREETRALWEARSTAEWTALGERFHFGDVLVEDSWRLALPSRGTCGGMALYAVPAQ